MRIGASARIYVVAIVLQLVDEGRIDLDDPLSRFVPGWPGGDGITTRALLDGSSGVASFAEPVETLAVTIAGEPKRDWTAADGLRIASAKPPRFAPGRTNAPVDTEYALLVEVVEAVTRSSFADAFAARLKGQLGLQATYLGTQDIPRTFDHGDVRVGYWDPDGSGTLVETRDLPAAVLTVLGSARATGSTVVDLARATGALHAPSPYLSETARSLLDQPIEQGGVLGRAMCPCEGAARKGVGVVGHTGAYTSVSVAVPSERLTIVIFANRTIEDRAIVGYLQDLHDLVWPAIR
jgi:CubicO group peptidase (beta-lactamase class C family)